jgi:hypothetical protein
MDPRIERQLLQQAARKQHLRELKKAGLYFKPFTLAGRKLSYHFDPTPVERKRSLR